MAALINTGLQIHRGATVVVPADIARTMLALQAALPVENLEYGVYLKGDWDPHSATVRIRPGEIYFPHQTVTAASIQFNEEPPGPEWNVVIHRHPAGCRQFSGTDQNSINEEFLASVLFIPPWDFPAAIVNIPLALGSKFQVSAYIEVDGSIVEPSEQLRGVVADRLQRMVTPRANPTKVRLDLQDGLGMSRLRRLRPDSSILDDPHDAWPSKKPLQNQELVDDLEGFHGSDLEDIRDAQRELQLGLKHE